MRHRCCWNYNWLDDPCCHVSYVLNNLRCRHPSRQRLPQHRLGLLLHCPRFPKNYLCFVRDVAINIQPWVLLSLQWCLLLAVFVLASRLLLQFFFFVALCSNGMLISKCQQLMMTFSQLTFLSHEFLLVVSVRQNKSVDGRCEQVGQVLSLCALVFSLWLFCFETKPRNWNWNYQVYWISQ